jgi:hypothetical protein
MEPVIEGELIEVDVQAGSSIAHVVLLREQLARVKSIAFFNRIGKPVRAETIADIGSDGSHCVARIPRNLLPPRPDWDATHAEREQYKQALQRVRQQFQIVTHESADSPVYARLVPGTPVKRIAVVQARPLGTSGQHWQADLIPDEDELVTHFVLGTEAGGIEYAGVFDKPIVLWAGHQMRIGVGPKPERVPVRTALPAPVKQLPEPVTE